MIQSKSMRQAPSLQVSQTSRQQQQILKNKGEKIGGGFQGNVFLYGRDKVVKEWRITERSRRTIEREIENAKYAGKHGFGPHIYKSLIVDSKAYMIMDRVYPIMNPTNKDAKLIIKCIEKAMSAGFINFDGGYAYTTPEKKEVVMYDFGVSGIYPADELHQKYNEYWETFIDFYALPSVVKHFAPHLVS